MHRDRKKHILGYQEIIYHLVFDIKLNTNFTCKAHFVADGSKTGAPKSHTYSSVISKDFVHIFFSHSKFEWSQFIRLQLIGSVSQRSVQQET